MLNKKIVSFVALVLLLINSLFFSLNQASAFIDFNSVQDDDNLIMESLNELDDDWYYDLDKDLEYDLDDNSDGEEDLSLYDNDSLEDLDSLLYDLLLPID